MNFVSGSFVVCHPALLRETVLLAVENHRVQVLQQLVRTAVIQDRLKDEPGVGLAEMVRKRNGIADLEVVAVHHVAFLHRGRLGEFGVQGGRRQFDASFHLEIDLHPVIHLLHHAHFLAGAFYDYGTGLGYTDFIIAAGIRRNHVRGEDVSSVLGHGLV